MKGVLQVILTYTMGIFKLPKGIISKLNALLKKFWWGCSKEKGRIQELTWKKLGLSKKEGGLGIRDLESFNLVMLSKQGWRLLQHSSSMISNLIKQNFYPKTNFLEAKLGLRPSYVWRSILTSQPLLKTGLIQFVGKRKSIKIWKDQWLPNHYSSKVLSPIRMFCPHAKVDELLLRDCPKCNVELIKTIFKENEAEIITV